MEAGNSSICTEDAFPPGSLEVGVINSQNFRSQELLDSCYVYLFCLATHQRLRQNKLGSLHSVKQRYQSVETTRRMENKELWGGNRLAGADQSPTAVIAWQNKERGPGPVI